MRDGYSPVSGSARDVLPGASPAGPFPGEERIEVTVVFRPDPDQPAVPAAEVPLTREELGRARGAAASDVRAVAAFADRHGLTVEETDPSRRRMVIAGPAGSLAEAFDVALERFDHPQGSYRGHRGPVHVPVDIAEAVVAVLGLDDRPQASVRFRLQGDQAGRSYTPIEIAAGYGYPTDVDGSSQRIAFIELGGGTGRSPRP
jgi:kumamolisin